MTNANFNLQSDLLHVETVLDRLLAAIEAVDTLGDSSLSSDDQMCETSNTDNKVAHDYQDDNNLTINTK